MEYRADIIVKLLQYIDPNDVLERKIDNRSINEDLLNRICYVLDKETGEATISKKIEALRDDLNFEIHEDSYTVNNRVTGKGISIFDLVNSFVRNVFIFDRNELVYKYKYLKEWHALRSQIGEEMIVSSAYAWYDRQAGVTRTDFLWKRMLGHNNDELNKILARGMSDNHYHLRCSSPYFELSWLTLMNCVSNVRLVNRLDSMDNDRRNPRVRYKYDFQEEKFKVLHLKAALIRIYLYTFLTGQRINLTTYYAPIEWLINCIIQMEPVVKSLAFWKIQHNTPQNEDGIRSFCETTEESLREFKEYLKSNCPRFYWLLYVKHADVGAKWEIKDFFGINMVGEIIQRIKNNHQDLELEECEWMFVGKDKEVFDEEWNRQTLKQLYYLLKKDNSGEYYALLGQRQRLQRLIDSFQNPSLLKQKDYAMDRLGRWNEKQWDRAVIAGERWIMYTMMSLRYQGEYKKKEDIFQLFYAYLLIKETFRMELLQSNEKIGFENFKNYQSRKNWFTVEYTEGELARLAVQETFNIQKLKSLELRIMPADTGQVNLRMIRRYNEAIIPYIDKNNINNFYYVFHFGKKKDKKIRNEIDWECRHEKYRYEVRKKVRAILSMREGNPKIADYLRGIDACSSEDGCRPEVFAVAFRALKSHVVRQGKSGIKVPQLRVTYHVGEDNQDILDGLRAIDEAIFFLNLDSGDRLGHATALGINVEKEYRRVGYQISIRKQDYLDNIVWLYNKILYYEIPDQENLLENLEKEFNKYFDEIYSKEMIPEYNQSVCQKAVEYNKEFGDKTENQGWYLDFNIYNYYNSWQLRGDEPHLYRKGYYRKDNLVADLWKNKEINSNVKSNIRYILEADILYHLYHYNGKIKKEGDQCITKKVSRQMVRGISLVQKKMQKEISRKGLAIETNPSSNILISSLAHYTDHPIITFYNKGLVDDSDKIRDCAQLNVSINTDDAGVFNTTLHNEYTLMANSLEFMQDINGEYVYQRDKIYDWIDAVRKMGNGQSFKDIITEIQE